MTTSLRVCLAILVAGAVPHPPVAAQASGAWSECNMDSLATWNCARYYTGTVTQKSELKGADFRESWSFTATVTAGRVMCSVVHDGTAFEGPGMLVVAQEGTSGSGGYEIQVWCPSEPGERVGRDDSPVIEILDRQAEDYADLAGTETYDSPDADAVNGITGTVTVTWRLRRT